MKIEFYLNSTLLGISDNMPFSYNWINAKAGEYILTAKAFDDDNEYSISEIVNLKIVKSDKDNDGIYDTDDNCPLIYNPDQEIQVWYKDSDGDGYGGNQSITSW